MSRLGQRSSVLARGVSAMGDERALPTEWYVSRGDKKQGPIADADLLRFVAQGKIRPDDLLWRCGFEDWRVANSIPGLLNPPLAPDGKPNAPQLAANQPAEATPRALGARGCLGIIGSSLLIGFLFALFASTRPPETPETRRDSRRAENCQEIAASIYAQDFVRDRLKAPSTAEFPSYGQARRKSDANWDCKFLVLGNVDAENGFGAKIRSTYAVELRYQPEDDKWIAESVAVEGP